MPLLFAGLERVLCVWGVTKFLWKSRKQAFEVSHPAAMRLPRGWGPGIFYRCKTRATVSSLRMTNKRTDNGKGEEQVTTTATAKAKCGGPPLRFAPVGIRKIWGSAVRRRSDLGGVEDGQKNTRRAVSRPVGSYHS